MTMIERIQYGLRVCYEIVSTIVLLICVTALLLFGLVGVLTLLGAVIAALI